MKKAKLFLVCAITFAITFVFALSVLCQDKEAKNWLTKKQNAMAPIKFYGKVVDQNGFPVVNATIIIAVSIPMLIPRAKPTYERYSNGKGIFFFDGVKGGNLYIRSITKNGYEDLSHGDKTSFIYRKDRTNRHVPNPEKPVIFHMRKKGENPVFLIADKHFDIGVRLPATENYYNFILTKRLKSKYREECKLIETNNYDLKVAAVFDEEKSDWTVTLTATGENSGFAISDQFLSEAPEQGYEKKFVFTQHVVTDAERMEHLENYEWVKKKNKFKYENQYLYIKSRNPVIFTRMRLGGLSVNEEWVDINCSFWTNPYGQRNLEAMEVPYGMGKYFYAPVKNAFLEGKRPEKPDVKKIWGEFKKTHERVKNSKTGEITWKRKLGM